MGLLQRIARPPLGCLYKAQAYYETLRQPNGGLAQNDSPPCGFCRQVILEMEQNQKHKIRVILHKIGGETYVFPSAASLLPLAFVEESLKK